jgi:hypothetical protein
MGPCRTPRLGFNVFKIVYTHRGAIVWAINSKTRDFAIGSCTDWQFDPESRCAQIGYELNRAALGQGIMSEVLRTLISYGFKELGLNRIEAALVRESDQGSINPDRHHAVEARSPRERPGCVGECAGRSIRAEQRKAHRLAGAFLDGLRARVVVEVRSGKSWTCGVHPDPRRL